MERCNYLSSNHSNGDFFTFEDDMIVSPGIFFGVYILNKLLLLEWDLAERTALTSILHFFYLFTFERICSSHWSVVWQRSFNRERLENKWVTAIIGTQHPGRPAPWAYTSSVATSFTCSPPVLGEYTWWFAACQHTDNVMQGWLQVFM